jgi:DNA-binding protein HU-beta
MALKTTVLAKSKANAKLKAAAKAAAPSKAAAPAKAPEAPKAKAAPMITLKQLAASLADRQDMAPKQASPVLGSLVELIVEHLKQADPLRIGGLGVLEVEDRPARMGRNRAQAGRPEAGAGHTGADGGAERAEPALVAGFRV